MPGGTDIPVCRRQTFSLMEYMPGGTDIPVCRRQTFRLMEYMPGRTDIPVCRYAEGVCETLRQYAHRGQECPRSPIKVDFQRNYIII